MILYLFCVCAELCRVCRESTFCLENNATNNRTFFFTNLDSGKRSAFVVYYFHCTRLPMLNDIDHDVYFHCVFGDMTVSIRLGDCSCPKFILANISRSLILSYLASNRIF